MKCKELLVTNMPMNEKDTCNQEPNETTYSAVTSGTGSGETTFDATSPDCGLSTLFVDTSSSKLERISATVSRFYK